jgi:hypothetical protein
MELTKEQENLLKQWSDLCETNKVLHKWASIYYKYIDNFCFFVAVALDGLSGIGILSNLTSGSNNQTVYYIAGGINMLGGLIQTIQKKYKPYQKDKDHNDVFLEYESLINDIKLKSVIDDVNSSKYISEIKLKLDKIECKSPHIPLLIYYFIKKYIFDNKHHHEDFQDTDIQKEFMRKLEDRSIENLDNRINFEIQRFQQNFEEV